MGSSIERQRRPGPGRRRKPRAERRLWQAVILTMFVCFGILVSMFIVTSWHTARTPPESAASVPRESPDTAGPARFQRLEWKEGQFVLVQYGTDTSTELDVSGFTDPATKNSHDLAAWAEMAWENQWGYVWGTFGQILTEDQLSGKLEQYPDDLGEYESTIREKWMGRRVADCVGLIKGYGWYDPVTGGIEYGSGGMPDTGTDDMWDAAAVKGDIGTMPDEPGLLVYSTAGHIGVYIGDGCAIEAISHAGGVVKTRVADRPWTGWLQCPYVTYGP